MSKNLANKIRLATVALMLTTLLVACSDTITPTNISKTDSNSATNKSQPTSTATPRQTVAVVATATATPPPVTVINPNLKASLTIWSDLSKDATNTQLQLLADEVQSFMQAYPGVTVNVVDFNPDELVTDFQNAVANDDAAPDLILSPSNKVTNLVAAKAIQPVDSLINSQQYAYNALAPGNFGGKQYGVPYIYGGTMVMLYNKKLVPTPPTDTKQLIVLAEKLNQSNDVGISLDINEPANLAAFLYAYGGSLLDAQNQPNLNTAAMQKVLMFFQDLERDRVVAINNDPSENTDDYNFRDGRLGFYFTTDTNALNYLGGTDFGNKNNQKANGVGLDLGIAPIPKLSDTGKNPSPFTNSEAMFVNSKASGDDLAAIKAFFSFVATPQEQSYMATRYHLLPPTTVGLASDAVKNNDKLSGLAAQLALDLPMPNQPQLAAVWDAIRPNLEKFTANAFTPQQAAQAMQQMAATEIQSMSTAQP